MLNHKIQLLVTLAFLLAPNQTSYGLFTHALNLFYDPGTHLCLMRLFLSILWLIYLRLGSLLATRMLPRLCQLCLSVLDAILAQGESSEQEREDWILEKALLGLFAVLVHGVADRLKFNIRSTDQFLDFVFLEMVGKHY